MLAHDDPICWHGIQIQIASKDLVKLIKRDRCAGVYGTTTHFLAARLAQVPGGVTSFEHRQRQYGEAGAVGRAYDTAAVGIQQLPKAYRDAGLANCVEIDIANCQPQIISQLLGDGGRAFKAYCKDRDAVLGQIAGWHKIDCRAAKTLVIAICFGASYQDWLQDPENGVHPCHRAPFGRVCEFAREVCMVDKVLRARDPRRYAALMVERDHRANSVRAIMIQDVETWIMDVVWAHFEQLSEQTSCVKGPVCNVFDSIYVSLEPEPELRLPEVYLREAEQSVKERTGFEIRLVQKSALSEEEQVDDEEEGGELRSPYDVNASRLPVYINKPFVDIPPSNVYCLRQIVCVCSRTGSGKTSAYVRRLKEEQGTSSLVITARRSQADMFRERFAREGLEHVDYRDLSTQDWCGLDRLPKRLIVQWESVHRLTALIHRLAAEGKVDPNLSFFKCIYLDEYRSLADRMLCTETNGTNVGKNVQGMQMLLSHAGSNGLVVFCTDSDALIDSVADKMLRLLCCDGFEKDMVLHRYLHADHMQRSVLVWQSEIAWREKLRAHIEEAFLYDLPVVVCFKRRRDLEQVRDHVLDAGMLAEDDVLVYHGGASQDNSLQNVNASWSSKTLILYTSTITVGVSFDLMCHSVFMHIGGGEGPTVRDMFQMAARPRKLRVDQYQVHCANLKSPEEEASPSLRRIEDGIRSTFEAHTAARLAYLGSLGTQFHDLPPLLKDIACQIREEKVRSFYYPLTELRRVCDYNGYAFDTCYDEADAPEGPDGGVGRSARTVITSLMERYIVQYLQTDVVNLSGLQQAQKYLQGGDERQAVDLILVFLEHAHEERSWIESRSAPDLAQSIYDYARDRARYDLGKEIRSCRSLEDVRQCLEQVKRRDREDIGVSTGGPIGGLCQLVDPDGLTFSKFTTLVELVAEKGCLLSETPNGRAKGLIMDARVFKDKDFGRLVGKMVRDADIRPKTARKVKTNVDRLLRHLVGLRLVRIWKNRDNSSSMYVCEASSKHLAGCPSVE